MHHTGPEDRDVIAGAAAPSRPTTAGKAAMTYINRQPADPTMPSAEVATAPAWLLIIMVVVARPRGRSEVVLARASS